MIALAERWHATLVPAWCPARVDRYRSGFTLIEVLIALVVSAMVTLGARSLLEATSEHVLRVTRTARRIDADANGERLLHTLVSQIEVASPIDSTFGGDERSVHFASWCNVPRGWLERCRVELTFEQIVDGFVVTAKLSTGEIVVVRRGRTADGLRYLIDPADGGKWLRQWPNSSTPPLAVGIVIDRDTLIARIGERG